MANPITRLPNPIFAARGYVNVPALGQGDTVWICATYTDGAVGYLNAVQSDPVSDGIVRAGAVALPFSDTSVDPYAGEFKTNRAYAIAGGLNHS